MTKNFDTLLESLLNEMMPADISGFDGGAGGARKHILSNVPAGEPKGHWAPLQKLSPEDRQWILNYIDEFIINELNISREDLPWLNGKKNINDWRNLVVMVRLSVAKILNTYLDIKKKENLN